MNKNGAPRPRRVGERWPWNRPVRRHRPDPPPPAERDSEAAQEYQRDRQSPLSGDTPHTHEDRRTPPD